MKALVYEALGKLEMEDVPEPKEPTVLKVYGTGICGTDLKTLYKGHAHFLPPTILGHEFYGELVKVAPSSKYHVGDKVVVAPYYDCGKCDTCKKGHGELCNDKHYVEGGSFAEFVGIPEDYDEGIFPIPEETKDEDAVSFSLTEPLSCVLTGASKLKIDEDSSVLIVGGGPMGALFAFYYQDKGVKVTLVEPSAERRAKLGSWGLTVRDEDSIKKGEFDNIVIAVNIPELTTKYVPLVRDCGVVLVFGGLKSGTSLSIDAHSLHYREVSVTGTSGFSLEHFKEAYEMIKKNPTHYKRLITHILPLEEGIKAFELLRDAKAFKVVLY